MRSWPAPEVPRLPGTGRPLHVLDASTGAPRPTPDPASIGEGVARMYVCGITPYDATHLGHAFTYLTFDLVGRVWRDAGLEVRYVQNATDVDDPLLDRARETGEDWQELAEREIELFRADMTALRVLPPERYIGAVESVPLIAERVRELRAKGAAYDVDDDVYFSVAADRGFGEVARLEHAAMVELSAERGGDPDRTGKKDPVDPLLWRAARQGEPSWESPLGPGRPGWHVECTTIALEHLGMGFDVQGGGTDLAFPHHEMGASHAHVLTGEPVFADTYVHVAMVGLDGEKMSKSRGNLVFVSKLRESGTDPMAIRLALLDHHYRTDWEWFDAHLTRAADRLARWREAAALGSAPSADGLLEAVRERLADDLDSPGALAAIDRWVDQAHGVGGSDTAAPGLLADLADALLGVRLRV
ncbi:MAG: cysteine--1-D-myo-inosityl 2-amino-2-deoxy-alpha-D-glucopyranoside ligase [Streptosporangiales bacterium]|nr:cysteine--1-D-myo-inosityl 2-amino-2-deoxy-alpha-D-glucopyranoside ligase [Streptosporangiales bacterium]